MRWTHHHLLALRLFDLVEEALEHGVHLERDTGDVLAVQMQRFLQPPQVVREGTIRHLQIQPIQQRTAPPLLTGRVSPIRTP